MPDTSCDSSRTAHLLALMKEGDDAFNARDFAAMDAVHHPDMKEHLVTDREEQVRLRAGTTRRGEHRRLHARAAARGWLPGAR